jgi:hypothetical protein
LVLLCLQNSRELAEDPSLPLHHPWSPPATVVELKLIFRAPALFKLANWGHALEWQYRSFFKKLKQSRFSCVCKTPENSKPDQQSPASPSTTPGVPQPRWLKRPLSKVNFYYYQTSSIARRMWRNVWRQAGTPCTGVWTRRGRESQKDFRWGYMRIVFGLACHRCHHHDHHRHHLTVHKL